MDNASNCNTTATELHEILPSFEGTSWRLRCLLHILNLIAKSILLFFYKQYKRKKNTGGSQDAAPSTATEEPALDAGDEDDEDGIPSPEDEELAHAAAAQAEDDATQTSPGEVEHDDAAAKSVKDRAIYEMRRRGVTFSDQQAKECVSIMTKVAGLARRINDAPSTLGVAFEKFVQSAPPENDDRNKISRRVATRWNSDYKCLDDYLILKAAVEALTSQSDLKLNAYRLTQRQWELSKELRDLLRIFVPVTEAFSQKEMPLISDVLEVLDDIKEDLTNIRDSPLNLDKKPASPIIRIAAHAGIIMTNKYFSMTDECEVYRIAIALSPDKKLQWFRDRDWDEDAVEAVRKLVLDRWTKSYAGIATATTSPLAQSTSTAMEMSHDTFNASMVVGSLAKLPSFDLKKAIDILENERFSD
ncbi:hypothetical protein K523DRAFT_373910 [Schizophyllum commune Tattone D]|nr:hypothetical protein K523DRAFT_373910 [Schizophyllum commune Tattone D]